MRSISSRPRNTPPLGSWNTPSSCQISSIAARRRTGSFSPNTSLRLRSSRVEMLLDIVFSLSGRRQDHTNQIFHFLPPTGSFFRYAYHGFLQEQPILSLDDLHRSRALLVVVRHIVDPTAHGVAPHGLGVVGLQQFRDDPHVGHARIKP